MVTKRTCLTALLLLALGTGLFGETIWGGYGQMNGSTLFDLDSADNSLYGEMQLSPVLQVYGSRFRFSARGDLSLNLPEMETDFFLREFSLEFTPGNAWKIQVGRFLYLPGSAEIFSNTNWFSSTDFIELIENQGRDFYLPGDMLQAGILGDSLYGFATLSATPVTINGIDPDSPWFPGGSIPEKIYSFDYGWRYLNELSLSLPAAETASWENCSIGVEAGWSTYLFDLSVQYYHGWDNEFLNTLDFDIVDEDSFDLIIRPERTRIDAFGLNWVWNLDSFHFWMDGAYSLNKSFMNETLRVPGNYTTVSEAPFLETTLGARYDFSWQNLTVLAEWRNGYIISDEERIVTPFLNAAVAGLVRMSLAEDRHRPGGFLLYSLDDKSLLTALQWQFVPADEFTIECTGAWLRGTSESFFGQFSQDLFLTVNLLWYF